MADDRLFVFAGISRRAFERMKRDLRATGVMVPDGDACAIRHRGVSGTLAYSESEERLIVRITEKPLFVSNAVVASLLDRVMRRYVRT